MNTKKSFLSLTTTFIMLLLTACNTDAQTQGNDEIGSASSDTNIEVIQFHSENRCMTCNKIEKLSKETLKKYPEISFSLVNVDDAKNEEKAKQFEAFGTSLFLYNPATGEKKNLTEFAFMNAGNEEKFMEKLKQEISLFHKL